MRRVATGISAETVRDINLYKYGCITKLRGSGTYNVRRVLQNLGYKFNDNYWWKLGTETDNQSDFEELRHHIKG